MRGLDRRPEHPRARRSLAVLVAAAGVLSACGAGAAEGQGQIEITKTTLDADSSAAVQGGADDDATAADDADEVGADGVTVPAYRQPPALPEGSGCMPTETEGLPTGRWFGYLIEVDADSFTFDLACRFVSTQAAIAAEEDGEFIAAGSTVYIRNEVADRRIVETNPGISINEFDDDGEDVQTGAFYPQWFVTAPTGIPVWVTKDPTRVSKITLVVES